VKDEESSDVSPHRAVDVSVDLFCPVLSPTSTRTHCTLITNTVTIIRLIISTRRDCDHAFVGLLLSLIPGRGTGHCPDSAQKGP